jgi:hypothetical protein
MHRGRFNSTVGEAELAQMCKYANVANVQIKIISKLSDV